MALDIGFNFRSTAGFVTDGPTFTYVIGDTYPTTRNGVTFGWESGFSVGNIRNRSAAVDPRFAGINFCPSAQQGIFRVDLPNPGQYEIFLANGDQGSSQTAQYLEIRDNNTVLLTLDDANGTAANNYNGIDGANYTLTEWLNSLPSTTLNFSSSIFRMALARTTAYGTNHVIANLYIFETTSGGNSFVYTPKSSGTVTVSWNANSEPDLAGYRVYYGTVSGVYTQTIDAGNVLEQTISGLAPNTTYFFAVTAYDTSNNESGFSNEASLLVWRLIELSGSAVTSSNRELVYSASGGAVTSGAATKSRRIVRVATGGAALIGSATYQFRDTNSFTYTGSGLVTTTGTAAVSRARVIIVGGGAVMSGAATTTYAAARKIFLYPGSGMAITSGASTNSKVIVRSASGEAVTSGVATSVFSQVQKQIFSYVGAGVVTTVGTATQNRRKSYTPTGAAVGTGAADVTSFIQILTHTYQGSGAATTGGGSTNLKKKLMVATGSAFAAGSAPTSLIQATQLFTYVGAGGIATQGTASVNTLQHVIASGGIIGLGGAANSFNDVFQQFFNYTGNGDVVASGEATTSIESSHSYEGSGGMTFGGSAPSSFFANARVVFEYTAAGALNAGGSAALSSAQSHVASGGIASAGGSISSMISFGSGTNVFQYEGDGEILMGGDPGELLVILNYDATGEILMGGDGTTEVNTIVCAPFRIFVRDCELEIKGWADINAYHTVSPFGGEHHEEPSGAEI